MAKVALVGAGVTGQRIAQRLDLIISDCEVVEADPRGTMAEVRGCDVAILAHGGEQAHTASKIIDFAVPVVTISDDVGDTRALIDLDEAAQQHGVPLVVGAGMCPGLTGLLARFLADQLHRADEVHIAVHGTAGPACARQHHRALAGHAVGLFDGRSTTRRAGSGRELCWFPEPVGAYDCYLAELASPMLIGDHFADATRISARMSATRRDRFTARLPMLSPPHKEGGVGAVRVEVRGSTVSGQRSTLVAGVAELVGTSAAATAAAFARAVLDGQFSAGLVVAGDPGLNTVGLLHDIERLGVRLQEFTGIPSPVG